MGVCARGHVKIAMETRKRYFFTLVNYVPERGGDFKAGFNYQYGGFFS